MTGSRCGGKSHTEQGSVVVAFKECAYGECTRVGEAKECSSELTRRQ